MNRFPFLAANRTWLIVWTVLLILLFASVGLKMISTVRTNQRAAAARHASRVDPDADEPGVTAADRSLPPGAKPILVTAGYYVDRIVEMSVKDVFWTVEFYLWFRWQGDTLKTCEGFDVVDGSVERKEKEVDETIGGQRYQRFRVLARITKFFDVTRFPCDDHLLTLAVELPSLPRHELMFVPDQQGSAVSSRVRIPSYTIW
ncbi:MAG: hypothetical protein NZM31_00005, partial [Gemmatales bacterium]|nr:hypothetical protein [Gemmatales bacterium]MDW8385375.1 hypothetical protein [Gemmatales bacterium]